jgi:hypothetical protein
VIWKKPSRSGSGNGGGDNCIEVGMSDHDRLIRIRDSKDPAGPVLAVTPEHWRAFIDGLR